VELPIIPTRPRQPIAGKWKTRIMQNRLLLHYITNTLPQVKKLLTYWEGQAQQCIDTELKRQALASLQKKAFHCQGGAVFAVPYGKWEPLLLELIVAYQTLCDFLDNLCDRTECTDGKAFRCLHQSLLAAVTPGTELPEDYYNHYPYHNDGGYIDKLVDKCRQCIAQLPSYSAVYAEVNALVECYIELQVHKHVSWDIREQQLRDWANSLLPGYPGIEWQEFAAASGSTLGLFALLGLATCPEVRREESLAIVQTYFPWVCGLHILLDYLIDQEEDRLGGDLNFTFYYPRDEIMIQRLKLFINQAHDRINQLPDPTFGKTVVEGLLAMYLSDQKVKQNGLDSYARELITESAGSTRNVLRLCRLVRKIIN
jgi:tetraprenyl-beta-curcumene synthase